MLDIPIATSGNPLGEYTHINNIIGPAIGVGGTIYNLVTLKSTNFIILVIRLAVWEGSGWVSGASSSSTRRYEKHEDVGGTRSCTGSFIYSASTDAGT